MMSLIPSPAARAPRFGHLSVQQGRTPQEQKAVNVLEEMAIKYGGPIINNENVHVTVALSNVGTNLPLTLVVNVYHVGIEDPSQLEQGRPDETFCYTQNKLTSRPTEAFYRKAFALLRLMALREGPPESGVIVPLKQS